MPEFVLSTEINKDERDSLFIICWKAFKDTPEIRVNYPGGLDPAHRSQNISTLRKGATSRGPVESYIDTITETQSGTIVSYVMGMFYDGPLGIIDGDLAKPPPAPKLPFIFDKEDREWSEWYWGTRRSLMREIEELQVPNFYISGLTTDPEWERHGAAGVLMNWILEEFRASKKTGRCVGCESGCFQSWIL